MTRLKELTGRQPPLDYREQQELIELQHAEIERLEVELCWARRLAKEILDKLTALTERFTAEYFCRESLVEPVDVPIAAEAACDEPEPSCKMTLDQAIALAIDTRHRRDFPEAYEEYRLVAVVLAEKLDWVAPVVGAAKILVSEWRGLLVGLSGQRLMDTIDYAEKEKSNE